MSKSKLIIMNIRKTALPILVGLLFCVDLYAVEGKDQLFMDFTPEYQQTISQTPFTTNQTPNGIYLENENYKINTGLNDLSQLNDRPLFAPTNVLFDGSNPNTNGGTAIGEVPVSGGNYIWIGLILMYFVFIGRKKW